MTRELSCPLGIARRNLSDKANEVSPIAFDFFHFADTSLRGQTELKDLSDAFIVIPLNLKFFDIGCWVSFDQILQVGQIGDKLSASRGARRAQIVHRHGG